MDNLSTMTLLLAIATFFLAGAAVWAILIDIGLRRKEYRIGLIKSIQEWLGQVRETMDENVFDPQKWASYEIYFKSKREILKKLLHLSSLGFYYMIPANNTFKKYRFKQKADEYMDSFGEFTDKLHEGSENPLDEDFTKDYADYELDFLNKMNDFQKFVINIFMREK